MDSGRCSTSVTLHLLINTFPLYGNEVRGGQIGQHLFIYGVVQNSLCWIHPEPEGKLDSINHLISQMHLQYFFKVLWLLIPTFFLINVMKETWLNIVLRYFRIHLCYYFIRNIFMPLSFILKSISFFLKLLKLLGLNANKLWT